MSEFHYVRTRGSDGGVDACEGPAIGLDLDTVLKDGLPPWNIALEIVAALCEILDIADEDGEVHGEVHPKYVFIDETGAVSLEGFGVKRKKTRAPEAVPKDTRADLYGLGYTAFRCFCSHPLPEVVPTDPTVHDDLVVDAALEIDLSGVPTSMQGDIQWYVAKLMEFDPEQRPKALDAWRTFVAFANASDGLDMADWCAKALDGGGARRTEAPRGENGQPAPAPVPTDDEDLGGPVVLKGPLAGIQFEEPSASSAQVAAKAGATAFWTRDEMKKALDRADSMATGSIPVPTGPNQAYGGPTPSSGGPAPSLSWGPTPGPAATAFWTQNQLDAIARGDDDAPRPRRAEGEGERRRVTATQRPVSAQIPSQPASAHRPTNSAAPRTGPVGVRTAPAPSGRPSPLAEGPTPIGPTA
ncbi:MAG: hypothetical protein ABMB14_25880, partial [Myxococcota bacterium]